MEPLQRLTRRQLTVLEAVGRWPTSDAGVPLNQLARALGVRPPSALAHLRALESERLVRRVAGKTRLTPAGTACLEEYRRHHRVAERLFASMALPPDDACRAALEIDLALSHALVERLCEAEGHPSSCPHGEPIAACHRDDEVGP